MGRRVMPRGARGDQPSWHPAPGRWWPGWEPRTSPPLAEEGEMLQPAEARREEEFQKEEPFTLTPGSQN